MIKKDVTPTKAPITNAPTPTPKTPIKKVSYKYAGKESISQIIGRTIPKQLIPTKRMATIFGAIFILVLILAVFQFPYSNLMSGDLDITIKIGYPWTFLELEPIKTDTSPLRLLNLFLDLILYIILAYAIDIIISLTLKNSPLQSKEQLKKKPKIFKDQKPSIAEKVAKKIS